MDGLKKCRLKGFVYHFVISQKADEDLLETVPYILEALKNIQKKLD